MNENYELAFLSHDKTVIAQFYLFIIILLFNIFYYIVFSSVVMGKIRN